ncbi:MAG: hypothetical protein ACOX8S_06585 [Christensenellales bacterium]
MIGKSFFKYLEGLRMNSAWELVTKTDMPIAPSSENAAAHPAIPSIRPSSAASALRQAHCARLRAEKMTNTGKSHRNSRGESRAPAKDKI